MLKLDIHVRSKVLFCHKSNRFMQALPVLFGFTLAFPAIAKEHSVTQLGTLALKEASCASTDSGEEGSRHQSPVNLPMSDSEQSFDHASWCVMTTNDPFVKVVFKVDTALVDGDLKPELTFLYEFGESGEIQRITQASRVKDTLKYFVVDHPGWNPFPVSFDTATMSDSNDEALLLAESDLVRSRLELLVSPLIQKSEATKVQRRRILTEGQYTSTLPVELHPYGAYWWPHSGLPLSSGPHSPLGKYDGYVLSKTGVDPKAREWESENHSLQHVEWGGHCNGWAASSVLHQEAKAPKWSEEINDVILTSDFNGMLAEASFCVDWAFYGSRYNGGADEDIYDIHADRFHKVLLYYIDGLKKPIAMDYKTGDSVDNHVIVGYNMKISKDQSLPLTYVVTNELSMYGYDRLRSEWTGTASRAYKLVYTYKLTTDEAGNIISGTWISHNPDFLWVPLAQKKCGRENPKIDHDIVLEAMSILPDAAVETVTTPALAFSGRLLPKQTVRLSTQQIPKNIFEYNLKENNMPDGFLATIECERAYPLEGSKTREWTFSASDQPGLHQLNELCREIKSVKIVNTLSRGIKGSFSIDRVSHYRKP
jgi:hypothetical protein